MLDETLPTSVRTSRAGKWFVYIFAVYVVLLILSNIAATKIVAVGPDNGTWLPLILDGGALMFPLTYIIDDILAEIFGFKVARRTILFSFFIGLLSMLILSLVAALPTLANSPDTALVADSFGTVFAFYPRILVASFSAFLAGQLLNSFVLNKIKHITGEERALWLRLIGSTVVGELVDTALFCTIAQWGQFSTVSDFLNYTSVGYIWKVGVEVVLLPVTYAVIKFLKAPAEPRPTQVL
ncbi:MAG: queuosine precursor transporter [Candidatus Ancillula sp.]|nr:queuosine precursor transporter [Candidatus Ancillula sp.]